MLPHAYVGRKFEFERHFLVDLLEQCFRILTLMISSPCGCPSRIVRAPCSSQPLKGPYSEVLLALLLETHPGAGFWPRAPLEKATVPAGKTQGGVFPPGFWLFSRRFSVCEVSFLFPFKKKKKDYNTAMIWTALGCVPRGWEWGAF